MINVGITWVVVHGGHCLLWSSFTMVMFYVGHVYFGWSFVTLAICYVGHCLPWSYFTFVRALLVSRAVDSELKRAISDLVELWSTVASELQNTNFT